jgi:hypothetical protein
MDDIFTYIIVMFLIQFLDIITTQNQEFKDLQFGYFINFEQSNLFIYLQTIVIEFLSFVIVIHFDHYFTHYWGHSMAHYHYC